MLDEAGEDRADLENAILVIEQRDALSELLAEDVECWVLGRKIEEGDGPAAITEREKTKSGPNKRPIALGDGQSPLECLLG